MQNQVQQNWGAGRNLAPIERHIDPLNFIASSLVMGALVFVAVLWLLWRPIPFIGLPRGSVDEHGPLAIKLGVHALFSQWFVHDAQWYATFWSQLSVPVSSFGLFREQFPAVR